MKAQRDRRALDAEMPLGEAARRIVAVRTAELYAFVPEALDEHAVTAMHDMRIAAKRLRYVLELVGFCLGEVGAEAQAPRARAAGGARRDPRLRRDARADRREPRARTRRLRRARRALSRPSAPRSSRAFRALWESIEQSGLRERLLAATISSPIEATRWAHNPPLR